MIGEAPDPSGSVGRQVKNLRKGTLIQSIISHLNTEGHLSMGLPDVWTYICEALLLHLVFTKFTSCDAEIPGC
jgi:hypothetical protein